MFGKSSSTKPSSGSNAPISAPAPTTTNQHGDQKIRSARVDTLIGRGTTIDGDLRFSGGLHVEGVIKGNLAADGDDATLILSEHGHIQGEVRVPSMVLNGMIDGAREVTKTNTTDVSTFNSPRCPVCVSGGL